MAKLKVTAVSYLNTKPLLYGLVSQGLDKEIDLQLDIPSRCAAKLKSGEVDLGLVPVAIIPELDTPHIISDYCIGAVGAVQTVCIYSDVPIEQVSHLYLDYHSRTSVALTRLLLRDYWQLQPELIAGQAGFEEEIGGRKAGLVIGDRAIGLDQRYAYCYDLGEVWMQHTGLPFVFAAWVSRRPLDPAFVETFNRAMAEGIAHIPQLIYLLPSPQQDFDLQHYFTHYISYELDTPKRQALARFLAQISERLQPSLESSLLI
ncbi:MAG: menaquinone biosynthesis protein [Bacteroidota bacterium]